MTYHILARTYTWWRGDDLAHFYGDPQGRHLGFAEVADEDSDAVSRLGV